MLERKEQVHYDLLSHAPLYTERLSRKQGIDLRQSAHVNFTAFQDIIFKYCSIFRNLFFKYHIDTLYIIMSINF